MLKQEVSTASSKGTTIKTGDQVKFVGNFPSAVSSIQNHPSRVMLLGGRAPEYLAHDPLVALVIKLFSSGKALASICLGQLILAAASVAKDHKFTAFPPVKPAPVASGVHWVEPDTSNSGGW
ncbi:protein DJ-1 homolog D-like [Arachis duranensis]|uniref:Protein DJ-1 homolog D-like n=1 Tax=Arachis duranensis TaxID=130453 RepID=A0A9C6TY87_ARADU|nr:protein DJ-1 homolog D-like [Arachis duranensis]